MISFEGLLTRSKRPNGGTIVFLRAILTSLLLYIFAISFIQAGDPSRIFEFSYTALKEAIVGKLPWFGAMFAAIYLALYSRFASQWAYVANLYNQIKAAEAKASSEDNKSVIAEWKAGFIEDAQELHLLTKGIFAGVAQAWLNDDDVRKSFIKYAPGGETRLKEVEKAVAVACRMQTEKFIK